ncbi:MULTISPECIES: cell wall metabolism sensor histidine kinase WalK [unclassified Arthrobacter]|uniref:sensor histidine kinase n=1 Tax=unclassified Arthrobacter TaxID=235627 RepID=UPI00159D274B|nr:MULTISPECIES: HAMP domain-containing sensor histidine kinase [unclassified Arthrobacter]MCQ9165887.1 HAMP domain-containing histidine kinase [Arthrobacter sp. STN4]NVM99074.1 HAMP domain-containing histidine kinase [Arthrobacter sp. SDTb3-6]
MITLWKNASLRSQLVAIISALLALSLLALGATTFLLLRSFLQDQMDAQLTTFQRSIAVYGTLDSSSTGHSPFGFDYYVGFHYSDSDLADQNRSGQDKPVYPNYTLKQATALNGKKFTVPSTDGGAPWRITVVAPTSFNYGPANLLGSRPEYQGYVVVGLPYESLNTTMERLAIVITGVAILAITLGTMIAYWTVSRSFRPLSRVEKTAAAIAAGDLSRRVDIENPSTEVGRLSGSLNTMLAHIEHAFAARTASEQRMRRFVADASHELRTPLVTIRGFSELYRHGALQTPDDVGTAMGRIESEAKRMGELVEDLLMLARLDEQRPLLPKPVDLLIIGHDAVLDARASARDRAFTVVGLDGGTGAAAPTLGDEAKLRQVVANLMGNALRYTPEGSPVEIMVGTQRADGHKVSVIKVRDHGPGISAEEAPRIFERFYRADSSRDRNTGGSGLGLAIVAAIVASHHGTVRVDPTPGGGATMVIELPFAEPDDAGTPDAPSADRPVPPEPLRAPGSGPGTEPRSVPSSVPREAGRAPGRTAQQGDASSTGASGG